MNWLDWLLAALLICFVLQGLWKGFTRQVIGLAALLIGLLAGLWFYAVPAAFLSPYLKSDVLANFLGFLSIFVGLQMAGGVAAWAVSKIWKLSGLSWLDRLLGGVFGVLKTGLVAVALVLALTAFPLRPVRDSVASSQAAPYILELAQVLSALAPQSLKDGFRKGYEEIQKIWNPAQPPGTSAAADGGRSFQHV